MLNSLGKNEQRCIARQEMGFYRNLIATALYSVPGHQNLDHKFFVQPLKACIADHPILSASVRNPEQEIPWLERPDTLDLRNHIEIKESLAFSEQTDRAMERFLTRLHDEPAPFRSGVPPWKIVVLPLETPYEDCTKFYVAFAYGHSHGDGKGGLAFHRSFLRGLQSKADDAGFDPDVDSAALTVKSSDSPLLPFVAQAANLYISWSCLFKVMGSLYFPSVASVLGLKSDVMPPTSPRVWLGKPHEYDPSNFYCGLQIFSLDHTAVQSILQSCTAHSVKLTGILHQALVYALDKNLSTSEKRFEFISSTPVDLRRLVPAYDEDSMTLCVSVDFELFKPLHPYLDEEEKLSEEVWNAARVTSKRLASRGSSLIDQPTGLMQYLSNFRTYFKKQFGKMPQVSYEITNLVAFDPTRAHISSIVDADGEHHGARVERVIFSQPANAQGSPFSLNVVTMKGGDLVITFTWQKGVLGLVGIDEEEWMRHIQKDFGTFLTHVASSK